MDGQFVHIAEDGTRTDVSEGVQALYDLVLSSMDWGSGFWTWEDALPVGQIGHLAGFEKVAEVDRYVADRKHDQERRKWIREHPEAQRPLNPASIIAGFSMTHLLGGAPVPHEHVFSSAGRCMWPRCPEREGSQ